MEELLLGRNSHSSPEKSEPPLALSDDLFELLQIDSHMVFDVSVSGYRGVRAQVREGVAEVRIAQKYKTLLFRGEKGLKQLKASHSKCYKQCVRVVQEAVSKTERAKP